MPCPFGRFWKYPGSGWVGHGRIGPGRVGSGRVWKCSKFHGSIRVESGDFQISRVGSDHYETDLTREKATRRVKSRVTGITPFSHPLFEDKIFETGL